MIKHNMPVIAVSSVMLILACLLLAAGNVMAESPQLQTATPRLLEKVQNNPGQPPQVRNPEWSTPSNRGAGIGEIKTEPGAIRFGDGKSGARPTSDGGLDKHYRRGSELQQPVNPAWQDTIPPSLIHRVALELRQGRTDTALQIWRQELTALGQKGQAPSNNAIENAIESIIRQANRQQAQPGMSVSQEGQMTASHGEDAQLANLELQDSLQKQQQAQQMMSNISKQLHDTAKSVIQNIR